MAAEIYEKIVKYIDVHIKEKITIDDISKLTGYSGWHLYKIFKVYSPVPIMGYIRNKRLCAAANEIYTGRRLYDIALDYGFETPAGFYKAFQSAFGCKPSDYKNNKNNKSGRNMPMNIETVKNIGELDEVLDFFKILYSNSPLEIEEDGLYSRSWWIGEFEKNPGLLIYAKEGEKICGALFGWGDKGGNVTVGGDGVLEGYKNRGIHEALFVEIEKRAKKLGFPGIGLGIMEGEEEFYAKLGYTGSMLIQSDKHSIDELKKVVEGNKNYEITGANIYDGYINQLWLRVSILDKELKKRYEEDLGGCWCQIIVGKALD
jgi:AraC-like DNA-binding protein/GNAT superfamily N-acetyltransferase